MRVLLTGASGFVGSHTLRALLDARRHDVAAIVRPGRAHPRLAGLDGRFKVISATLEDLSSARDAILAFRPDAIVHLAWSGVEAQRRNDVAQFENLDAIHALIEIACESGARRWIGLGSQAEYGPAASPITEDTETRPATRYGKAKLAAGLLAEHLCAQAGLRFAWVRLFSMYGPGDHPGTMISSLISALMAGSCPPLTMGTQLWDYIYAEDAARAICAVIESSAAVGVLNLGSGSSAPIRTVVEKIGERVAPHVRLRFGELLFRPDQVMHLEADTSRLRALTDWRPQVGLDEGIARTISWTRSANAGVPRHSCVEIHQEEMR